MTVLNTLRNRHVYNLKCVCVQAFIQGTPSVFNF